MLYDNIALLLATSPILLWPVTIVTAPATLFVVIRYWRKSSAIVPRTKVRFVIAGLIALLQLVGWGFLVYAFWLTQRARFQ